MSGELLKQSQLILDDIEGAALVRSDFFARELIEQVQRDLGRNTRHTVGLVSRWVVVFDYLRTRERELNAAESPMSREIDQYKATVSLVKALGLLLLEHLRRNEEVDLDRHLGYGFDDVEACVEHLEMEESARRQGEMPEARVRELESVFGEG